MGLSWIRQCMLTIRSGIHAGNTATVTHRKPAPPDNLRPLPRCYVGKDFFHAHPEGVARRFGSSERIFSGAIRAEIFQR